MASSTPTDGFPAMASTSNQKQSSASSNQLSDKASSMMGTEDTFPHQAEAPTQANDAQNRNVWEVDSNSQTEDDKSIIIAQLEEIDAIFVQGLNKAEQQNLAIRIHRTKTRLNDVNKRILEIRLASVADFAEKYESEDAKAAFKASKRQKVKNDLETRENNRLKRLLEAVKTGFLGVHPFPCVHIGSGEQTKIAGGSDGMQVCSCQHGKRGREEGLNIEDDVPIKKVRAGTPEPIEHCANGGNKNDNYEDNNTENDDGEDDDGRRFDLGTITLTEAQRSYAEISRKKAKLEENERRLKELKQEQKQKLLDSKMRLEESLAVYVGKQAKNIVLESDMFEEGDAKANFVNASTLKLVRDVEKQLVNPRRMLIKAGVGDWVGPDCVVDWVQEAIRGTAVTDK